MFLSIKKGVLKSRLAESRGFKMVEPIFYEFLCNIIWLVHRYLYLFLFIYVLPNERQMDNCIDEIGVDNPGQWHLLHEFYCCVQHENCPISSIDNDVNVS